MPAWIPKLAQFCCLLTSIACLCQAQESPVFRSDVRYVSLNVEVLSEGKPVTDLRAEDFQIWDEGQLQRISHFGYNEQELDILLLLDLSGSVLPIQQLISTGAAKAMLHLKWRDRVGIAIFNSEPYLVSPLTWDRMETIQGLSRLPGATGLTEVNSTTLHTARYLKEQSRPDAGRAIVMLTDNCAKRTASNADVRHELWERDVMFTAILFSGGGLCPENYTGDVRPFAAATGGVVIKGNSKYLPLAEVFQSLRQRYTILYQAPAAEPGSVRMIRVALTDKAKARYRHITIRTRTGYIVGQPDSDSRQRLTQKQ